MTTRQSFSIRVLTVGLLMLAVTFGGVGFQGVDEGRAATFDINNDGQTGVEELIHILQIVSGIQTVSVSVVSVPTNAPAPFLSTGQTSVWSGRDDGDLGLGVAFPSPRFTDLGDGTARDELTGLIWLKNAGRMGKSNWNTAFTRIGKLNNGEYNDDAYTGTFTDWRLPNLNEMQSLRDMQYFEAPLTPGHPFSGTVDDYYWTSTTLGNGTGAGAWYVDWKDGAQGRETKDVNNFVWAVRGPVDSDSFLASTGQTISYRDELEADDDGALELGVPMPDPRFTDLGNGCVKDNLTNLVWLKNAARLGKANWSTALARVAKLNNGDYNDDAYTATYTDWHLPNLSELQSIRDLSTFKPPVANTSGDTVFFTGIAFDWYWTSTTLGNGYGTGAWYMDLTDGASGRESKDSNNYAWPVRFASEGE